MSRAPIDMMLDGLEWVAAPAQEPRDGDLPHVTHSGVLDLMGHSLRCYRLSNGQTVFDGDDFEALMKSWLGSDEINQ